MIVFFSPQEITLKMQQGITLTKSEQEKLARLGDLTGRIAKAKDDLERAKQGPVPKSSSFSGKKQPPKKSENDVQWENLIKSLNRKLEICDMDFSDLTEADDLDVLEIRLVYVTILINQE